MTRKKLSWIEWKPRKKIFCNADTGLEVKVTEVIGPPRVFETDASASNPLNYQIDGFARRAARGTDANAFSEYSHISENYEFPDARWSPAQVTIQLYKIKERV
jgi:hypothetical protein